MFYTLKTWEKRREVYTSRDIEPIALVEKIERLRAQIDQRLTFPYYSWYAQVWSRGQREVVGPQKKWRRFSPAKTTKCLKTFLITRTGTYLLANQTNLPPERSVELSWQIPIFISDWSKAK